MTSHFSFELIPLTFQKSIFVCLLISINTICENKRKFGHAHAKPKAMQTVVQDLNPTQLHYTKQLINTENRDTYDIFVLIISANPRTMQIVTQDLKPGQLHYTKQLINTKSRDTYGIFTLIIILPIKNKVQMRAKQRHEVKGNRKDKRTRAQVKDNWG